MFLIITRETGEIITFYKRAISIDSPISTFVQSNDFIDSERSVITLSSGVRQCHLFSNLAVVAPLNYLDDKLGEISISKPRPGFIRHFTTYADYLTFFYDDTKTLSFLRDTLEKFTTVAGLKPRQICYIQ
eukprot:TRINITY_DN2966_c0_g1_i2.p1 TRINITY_DN2966_c0_g1~~TRINITY_DN2966_c0_g1_i2.p1  ORF type:complete len:130 (+),score=4.20 TRINITY_DN2966_c0_g1_i2:1038-1427(+)